MVAGSDDDLALCGAAGGVEGVDVSFALGGGSRVAGGGGPDADVRFLTVGSGSGAGRVVAPAGEGLWRRAPWPVNDALFEWPAAADPRSVTVVGAPGEGREEIVERLRGNALSVAAGERLTVPALRDAAVVVLLGGHGALPAHAPAVLAARRVLITDAPDVAFGLQPGIEFLPVRSPGDAVEHGTMACLHPRVMASLRALGARAARDHRASLVYPRLAAELAADR